MYSLSTCDWNELESKKTSSQTGHSQYTDALVAFTNSTASATASAPAELPILAQCAVKSSTLTVRKLQTSSSVSGNALRRERDGGGGGGTVAWWETPVRASASARTPRSRSRATATRHCGVAAMRPRPDTAWRAGSVGAPTASARALREGLAGPARVEERGGEGGGDLGAPRREPRRAAERRDRVPGPRERGARVADDVVRERGAPVARGEALRRGAVVSPMDRERRAASASSRKAAVASSQSALVGADAEAAPLFRGILRLFLRRPMAVAVFPGDAPVKSAKAAEITNGSEEREATKLTSNDSSRGRGPTCHCKIFFEPILCKSFLLKLKTDLCASS